MRFSTLRGRLTWLFVGFFLLVSVSAAVTFRSLDAQSEDALLINLAGRQRMLIQQMTRLTLELDQSDTETLETALAEARSVFDRTLHALRYGGDAPYLAGETAVIPAARAPQLVAQLQEVDRAWRSYAAQLDKVVPSAPGSPERRASLAAVDEQSRPLLLQADAVVRLYQQAATDKVNRLRTLQIGFLIAALLLLALASWLIRSSLLVPLQQLDQVAAQMGMNALATPVQVAGPAEIALLSQTMETMRARLQSSRDELVHLATTLESRVAQRTRELDALNEVSHEITSQLDVQHVLRSVTEKAHSLLDAEVASLCLLDEGGQWLHLSALSGPDGAVVDHRVPAGAAFAREVLASNGSVACGNDHCCEGCHMLTDVYRSSHLAASLHSGERVIGALCVGSLRPDHFSRDAAESLAKLANTASIALENARLYAQAERVAALEERSRIAADMHDGLGQTLSYLGLMTERVMEFLGQGDQEAALERLYRTRETIEQATGEVRRAINRLLDDSRPAPELCTRVQNVLDDFAQESPFRINWLPEVQSSPICSRQTAEQVENIVREALTNVTRHARAQEVAVRLGRVDGHYFVAVQDDGQGFDTSQAKPEGHFGLQVMQARAEHIGGQLQVDSTPGRVATVKLTWPARAGE